MACSNPFHDLRSFLFLPMLAFTILSCYSFMSTHVGHSFGTTSIVICSFSGFLAAAVEVLILLRRDAIHDWSLHHQPPYIVSSLASVVIIVFTALSRQAATFETHDTVIWGLVCLYSMAAVVFCGGRMLRILSDFGFFICFCSTAVTLAVVEYHLTWTTWVCVLVSCGFSLLRGTWLHFDPPILVPILVEGQ